MKNKSKWAALLVVLLLAALLTGCSLAREDGTAAVEDELIGVMVRYRPNGEDDHFYEHDAEAAAQYLLTHASELEGGESTLPEGLNGGTHVLTDEDRNLCVLFETAQDENEEGPYTYTKNTVGEIFNTTNQSVAMTDEGEAVEVSAEVYIDATCSGENAKLYIDPVYQRADGLVYVMQDSGFFGLFGGVAKTISAESTRIDSEGKKIKRSASYEVSVKAKPRVTRAVLIEMDENNQPVASREIDLSRDELVEFLSPETAWALVETQVIEADWGEAPVEKTERKLIELENGQGETTLILPARQDGILVLKSLTVAYPGVKLDTGI